MTDFNLTSWSVKGFQPSVKGSELLSVLQCAGDGADEPWPLEKPQFELGVTGLSFFSIAG